MNATHVARTAQRATSADPFKYHRTVASPFWEKFRKAVVVNADSTSGLPLPNVMRYPEPANQDPNYVTPASKASDVAENNYYARDARRNYPKLQAITQDDLATLLIASPEQLKLPTPASSIPSTTFTELTDLSKATRSLATLYSGTASTSSSWKPPVPPGKKHVYFEAADKIPHAKHAYFPMINYS